MRKDVLFRGCTRPAMFLGVPYIPFFVGAGGGLMMGMYFDLWFLLTIPVFIFIMQQMAKRDEMIFRLLGLRWLFRMRVRNLQRYSGMWVFSPNEYRKVLAGKRQ
ncbi:MULTISPECIES: type IV secretion system protein VirB3 [Xanthomonas]|jgi:type IV secretion system protein VirB3|uniref:Type IV secretion system protein VirB3 n=1 Tax=Xanthomonas arboricola TaxID=56448 RepID=A0AB73H3F7_9XANT|nr:MULTISPECIES: VirB3 family type IV secretion system protein [Xanthomonas]MBB3759304.1 type IV secretion system protein VirB3 [Xanthomonas arboricola]MBB3796571.1 type IV secretion system protein VirB3 [Xanthomonas arboricola]MBB4604222.1 type IV secretion system protein VirB3 [Xanthomonas arboricola]MBB4707316.1 type IV secretion system protein VirB3 [Xanthomonas arboricola]MBB4726437.1 type IV secretion system protein VirB3 [Xanthomonas arboricola]